MEKSINDFIKELQRISPEKRELPLIILAPNGTQSYPSIKMFYDEPKEMFSGKGPEKMMITWRD